MNLDPRLFCYRNFKSWNVFTNFMWCRSLTIRRELGQYHGCWCPGFLHHQVIIHSINPLYAKFLIWNIKNKSTFYDIIKSPQYTGGDFMFLFRFVRRRRCDTIFSPPYILTPGWKYRTIFSPRGENIVTISSPPLRYFHPPPNKGNIGQAHHL